MPVATSADRGRFSKRPAGAARRRATLLATVLVACLAGTVALAQSTIVGSKHDLAERGGTNETCVFCHTPHQASLAEAPLWNRKLGPVTFLPYGSATTDSPCPATPSPQSQACLSCHDGVNASNDKHDLVVGPRGEMPDQTSWPNCASCHPEIARGGPPVRWLGTDLRNDHPISMAYPTAAQDPAFNAPPDQLAGWNDVKLFAGRVECPTCHNVHNPSIRPFLRKPNSRDGLCLTCHIK